MKLLKFGNAKLDKSIAIFNLPAVVTCGRACPGCYALKAEKRFPAVKAARARNLQESRSPLFPVAIAAELESAGGKVKAVRIHESGDFYSPEYVAKWRQVAEMFPAVTFYAYTKRLGAGDGIAAALRDFAALPNVVIIDSLQYGPVNYGDNDFCVRTAGNGAFLCPCGTGKELQDKAKGLKTCGVTCRYCMTKEAQDNAPVFLKH